jgi:hypothetical protein
MVVLKSKCGAVIDVNTCSAESEVLDNNQAGMFRVPICEMPLTERIRF